MFCLRVRLALSRKFFASRDVHPLTYYRRPACQRERKNFVDQIQLSRCQAGCGNITISLSLTDSWIT